MPLRLSLLALLCCATPVAEAQDAAVFFDEDDAVGVDYYDASEGTVSGGDVLDLAGPGGDRMPIEMGAAQSGSESGRIAYEHTADGAWSLIVGAPGFASQDLTDADSLVVFLNGPAGIPDAELPRIGIEDASGVRTALLPLDPAGSIGYDPGRSGFLPSSDTDASFEVSYVPSLPATLARPGYPEDLTFTFADVPLDTSTAAIGVPAVPAHFRIDAASGLQLDFRFRDPDGDGTLSDPDEYVVVLTEDPESGGLRPTWRVELGGLGAADPPGEGDAYLLAVDNGGVDGDPASWQRLAVALADFGPLGDLDLGAVRGVRFENGGTTFGERTLWIDFVAGLTYGGGPAGPPPPSDIDVRTGDGSVVLRWERVPGATGYHVYRRTAPDLPFVRLTGTPTAVRNFADVTAENGETNTYVLRSLGPGNVPGPDSGALSAAAEAGVFDPYLDLVAETAFGYFWEEANPDNGLIKDRSTSGSASSIAAVGMGLSALTVGIDRGWISREEGRERVRTTLDFFWTCPQSDAPTNVCGYRGFFYHFLDMQTGHRAGTNELSTIDTALLLGGILHAKEYFTQDTPAEEEIRALADSIYYRVEWDWATPNDPLVALGWRPESGFIPFDWRGYNEAMILYLLGLGSPTHPLADDAWDAWTASYDGDWGTFYGFTYLSFPPLFGHQYSHLWFDFRGIQDDYMREKSAELGAPIDYFENSRRATLAQRAYSIANPAGHPNYGPEEWGLTASDGPFGYLARGAPPAQNDDGTITPTAPGGSIVFAPDEAREALRTFYRKYRPRLWGEYGLLDAYNVRETWVGTDFLGIDQGPFVIMIENLRTEAIWDAFMQNEDVQRGLGRAGFEPTAVGAEEDGVPLALALDAFPNPAARRTTVRFTTPSAGSVHLAVYDLLGRRVALLADGPHAAGTHPVLWQTTDLASGVYVLRLEADGAVRTRRITLVR
jgi:hypothetical protein